TSLVSLCLLQQLSSGNPVYDNYFRQVDRGNTGQISAGDAAQFLKKSGLSDSTLGKIWDLADSERKGYLDKRGFFIALRLVASAQGGNDISLNNLNQTLAPPKFKDTGSPLASLSPVPSTQTDSQWAIRPDEKGKFDGIFESLLPVNGLLPGDKVKPVLINSKLPLEVLGKIWEISDVDQDGQLDKEEFSVAMHLVYRAMEQEPVPATLPSNLIPPSKRRKSGMKLAGAVAVLPGLFGMSLSSAPSPLKETLRPTPSLSAVASLGTPTSGLSPKHSFKSSPQQTSSVNWVVPLADRGRYDDLFLKTDTDMDGLVTGTEVIEIFMLSSLPQTMLAQIWGLADTKQMGKLSREQFSLAMYLIQQKVSQGTDPPQSLTPDMIPPSERSAPAAAGPDSNSSSGSADLTGIKELDDLSQEIAQLQRDKYVLELEIREKEEAIRQQNTEVQEMQVDLDRENGTLQDAESQKQDAKERLEEMDQQRSKLEGMLNDVKVKCQDESQTIASLQSQIRSQELDLRSQEDEMGRTKGELSRLQEEEALLGQNLLSGRVQLDSITKSLRATQDELNQVRPLLHPATGPILKDGPTATPLTDSWQLSAADSFKSRIAMFNSSNGPRDTSGDPFQTEDPFKADSFQGLSPSNPPLDAFGGDPFKATDPFKGTSSEDFFKKTDKSDLFASSDPFGRKPTPPLKVQQLSSASHALVTDAFGKTDAFGNNSFGSKGGFADFTQMSKVRYRLHAWPPPRVRLPQCGVLVLGSSFRHPASLQQPPLWDPCLTSPLSPPPPPPPPLQSGSERQQMEWARRESQREEQERQRWLRRMEHEDLERAIALSKAQMPST
uniref:Epidermal growth factor receptor substrate 15-like 1 n=1 Tax=Gadus morhua TaxID=8049 RepID=A0A8C4ZFI0_GADMO